MEAKKPHEPVIITPTLEETLSQALGKERIEVLAIDKPGDRLVIVRDKMLPSMGIPIWSDTWVGTAAQVVFRIPEGGLVARKYQVMCVCCNPENRNTDKPPIPYMPPEVFSTRLYGVAKANGITRLVVRYARDWFFRYDKTPPLSLVEAAEADDNRPKLPFIDYTKSSI